MTAIAAVALTEGLTVPQILAAGIIVSAFILVLGVTGLITWLNRGVPKSVVRGLQLALGLTLLMRALQMIAGTHRMFGLDSYFTGSVVCRCATAPEGSVGNIVSALAPMVPFSFSAAPRCRSRYFSAPR
jgi:predicted benzoate:H+ symporter BenE